MKESRSPTVNFHGHTGYRAIRTSVCCLPKYTSYNKINVYRIAFPEVPESFYIRYALELDLSLRSSDVSGVNSGKEQSTFQLI